MSQERINYLTKVASRLKSINTLALVISMDTEAKVFVNYSGHVNAIEVEIHRDGWKSGKPDYRNTIYLDYNRFEIFESDHELNVEHRAKTLNELEEIDNILLKLYFTKENTYVE